MPQLFPQIPQVESITAPYMIGPGILPKRKKHKIQRLASRHMTNSHANSEDCDEHAHVKVKCMFVFLRQSPNLAFKQF